MKAVVGKRYRHYKNGKEYIVLAIAYQSETMEKMVIYEAQYDTEDLGEKPVFARPQEMFEEHVEVGGKLTERFTKID
jgi:hypothetical protein